MAISFHTNTPASKAYLGLEKANVLMQKSLSRLSSGQRIASVADDAGGLSVAYKLKSKLDRNEEVVNNLANASSFLDVQQGALDSVGNILSRMSELKTMSLDVTKNSDDKEWLRSYHDHGDISNLDSRDQLYWSEDNANWLNFLSNKNVRAKIAVMHSENAPMAPDRDESGEYVNPEGVVTEGFVASDIELSSNNNFPFLRTLREGASVADQVSAFHAMFDSLTNGRSNLPEILVFNVDNSSSMGFQEVREALLQFKSEIEAHYATQGKEHLIPQQTSDAFTAQLDPSLNGSGIAVNENGYFRGIRINQGEDYVRQGKQALDDGLEEYKIANGHDFQGTLDDHPSGIKTLYDSTYGLADFDMSELEGFIQALSNALAVNGAESQAVDFKVKELNQTFVNSEQAHGRIMDADIAQESTRFTKHNILLQASATILVNSNQLSEVALSLIT